MLGLGCRKRGGEIHHQVGLLHGARQPPLSTCPGALRTKGKKVTRFLLGVPSSSLVSQSAGSLFQIFSNLTLALDSLGARPCLSNKGLKEKWQEPPG